MAHILIIEDEDLIRQVIRAALEKSGHTVALAGDGRQGLASHREVPADLVVTDLIMPGMEGLETIMEFKKQAPNVKIIAISGGGVGKSADYLVMAKRFGAHRTIAKPFRPSDLATTVTEMLSEPAA